MFETTLHGDRHPGELCCDMRQKETPLDYGKIRVSKLSFLLQNAPEGGALMAIRT